MKQPESPILNYQQTIDVIKAHFRLKERPLDFDEGYQELRAFLALLEPMLPTSGWHRYRHSLEGKGLQWISILDEDAYVRACINDISKDLADGICAYPTFVVYLTTASDDTTFGQPGRVLTTFAPTEGVISIEFNDPDIDDEMYEGIRRIFHATCRRFKVIRADCDIPPSASASKGSGLPSCKSEHPPLRYFRLFRWIAWAGPGLLRILVSAIRYRHV